MLDEFYSQLDQAKYNVVHDYNKAHPDKSRRGPLGLSPLLGRSPNVISNKVNPNSEAHHLTVDEAVAIQNAAKDYRILQAEAAALNHVCIELADFSGVSDVELLNAYARLHKEIGDLAATFSDALEDKRITRREFSDICKEGDDIVQAFYELRARVEGLVDD